MKSSVDTYKSRTWNHYIDFNRAVGILPYEEQIPGEQYKRGDRIRAYMFSIEESPRSVTLRLSCIIKIPQKLFEMGLQKCMSGMVRSKTSLVNQVLVQNRSIFTR